MGDFKFIVFMVFFFAIMGVFGYYINEDINNPSVQENFNYSDSTGGEASFTSYKSSMSMLTTSDYIIIAAFGSAMLAILVFVILRYARGQ